MGGLSRKKDYGSKKKPYPKVKSKDFAGKGRSYPIPTRADAVDALRLAGLHGRSDIRAKVFKKYPGLKKKKAAGGDLGDPMLLTGDTAVGDSTMIGMPLNKVITVPSSFKGDLRTQAISKAADDMARKRWANVYGGMIDFPGAVPALRRTPEFEQRLKSMGKTWDYVNSYQPSNYENTLPYETIPMSSKKQKGGPLKKKLEPKNNRYVSPTETPELYNTLSADYKHSFWNSPLYDWREKYDLSHDDYLQFRRDYMAETRGMIENFNKEHGTNYDPLWGREKFLKKTKEEYGFGGWLKENAGTIGTVAGGIGGAFLGNPMLGAGIGSTIGGLISESGQEETSNPYMVPTSLPKQFYQRAAMGGKLTKFTGPRHEQGGIQLGGLPVEVEGGETRTGNMIHSDRIKVTKPMLKRFPALKKSDVGKTMAEITESRSKKFEGRENDELNDEARRMTMAPLEDISNELSIENDLVMASGGSLTAAKARKILHDGSVKGHPLTDKQRRFFGWKSNQAADGMDIGAFLQDPGNLPILTSAIGLFGSIMDPAEEVNYGKVNYSPVKTTMVSASPRIQGVRRTFANAESKLRKYNAPRYLARMGELAANEASAVSGVAGDVENLNASILNRASLADAESANRVNLANTQIGMQEAEANAANRAMKKTRTFGYLNSLATMSGQKARDDKLMAEQQRYNNQMLQILRGYQDFYNGPSQDSYGTVPGVYPTIMADLEAEKYKYPAGAVELPRVEDYTWGNGGDLSRLRRLRMIKR